MRRFMLSLSVVVGVLALLAGIRFALEPEEAPWPEADSSPASRDQVVRLAGESGVAIEALEAEIASIDILLVGEEHFYRETTEFLTSLLESVEGRRVALLLEIPRNLQDEVDIRVETGKPDAFDTAVREGKALPYGHILAWAHENREQLSAVEAFDETATRVFVQRALLNDTRNRTMADAIMRAHEAHPGDLVVAYGGQLHMILSGRYRYDRPDRTPAGALLLAEGLPRSKVRSVLLSGRGKSPIADLAPEGIVHTGGPIGDASFLWFIEYPIFGAEDGSELFDYLVNLGELTRLK